MTDETDAPATKDAGQQARALPPIHRVRPPDMHHMSTKIRWYIALGYTVGEVSKFLGLRYQQVRNVATTTPKRAAREDLPPLIVETWEVDDDLEAMDKHAMEVEMGAQRAERRALQGASRRARRTMEDAEAQFGNPELDDEDYGR